MRNVYPLGVTIDVRLYSFSTSFVLKKIVYFEIFWVFNTKTFPQCIPEIGAALTSLKIILDVFLRADSIEREIESKLIATHIFLEVVSLHLQYHNFVCKLILEIPLEETITQVNCTESEAIFTDLLRRVYGAIKS